MSSHPRDPHVLRLEVLIATDAELDKLASGERRDDPRKPWSPNERKRLARRALLKILKAHSPVTLYGEV